MSSQTVINSFIRKYAAILDSTPDEIRQLFQYRVVTIGHPVYICGAKFTFEYSFHSIPTLCFEVEYLGKKFFFSGDTHFDPEKLKVLYEQGIFSRRRYERLAFRDFNQYDLILHEAGIPPIHTPLSVLQSLPAHVRDKLYLIHIAEKDVVNQPDLKVARIGLDHSLTIIEKRAKVSQVESNLDVLSSFEIINWIPLNRISEIIKCFTNKTYKAGENIISLGTKSEHFYIVKTGAVRLTCNDPENKFSKVYLRGDFFGESVLIQDGERLADVTAISDTELLVINKYDFLWIFKYQMQNKSLQMNPVEAI